MTSISPTQSGDWVMPATHPVPRVLMVGPALEVRGGISAVERVLMMSVPPEASIMHVASMVEGTKWRKLLKFLRTFVELSWRVRRGDVVHIHFASGASSRRKTMIARLALARGARVILHAHGGGYREYWRSMNSLERAFTLKTLQRVQRLVVLGEQWQSFFASIGVTPQRIVALPNPVVLPRHIPQRVVGREVRLLFLGLIDRRKGAFDLVDAIARIAPSMRTRLRAVIAGNGATDELRLHAAKLGVADLVDVREWVDAQERDRLLAASDMFVLPSYAEGLPMSVLEAMAWGLPTICTPVGSVHEFVKDGVNGLLVQPGQVDALTQAIERLAADQELRSRLGRVARATVEPLDASLYVKKMCSLYRSVAAATPAP